jgi:hypothetical membrane protein
MITIYYFLKWNFTNMESYSKRYLAYLALGLVGMFTIGGEYFYIAPALMFVDLTVDIVRSRYQDFRKEQQQILDDLKKS